MSRYVDKEKRAIYDNLLERINTYELEEELDEVIDEASERLDADMIYKCQYEALIDAYNDRLSYLIGEGIIQ